MKKFVNARCRAQKAKGSVSKGIKLIVFMMLTMSTYGNAASQPISLKLENSTLREALSMIKKQTEVYLAFNEEAIATQTVRLTMSIEGKSLYDTLSQIFEGLPFDLEYTDTTIIIKPSQRTQQQSPPSRVTVTGKVTDTEGKPLSHVTVMLEGTNIGVFTDGAGNYTLTFPARDNGVIVYTFLSMKTERRNWNGQKSVNVAMNEEVTSIEETVVTGYQVLNKREQSGSTFSPKMDDLPRGYPTLDKSLQGLVPGMMVMNSSGEPGVTSQIRIRGNSTITSNKAPVWVVDGVIYEQAVPFDASDINSEDAAYLIGNAVAGINPQDIESITVLKDASATAIYGVKAANGVIVLTTKKGVAGPARIQYDGNVSFKIRPSYKHYDRMNSKQRVELSRDIVEQQLKYPAIPTGDSYEGALQDLMAKKITREEFEARVSAMQTRNTDWFKELFTSTITQSHKINLSGGAEKVRYYFSAGYSDDRGGAKNSSSKRYDAMGKINASFKWLDVEAKINYSTSANEGYNGVNPFDYAYKTTRTLPLYNDDGSYHRYTTGTNSSGNSVHYNIMQELENTGKTTNVDRLESLLALRGKILTGFEYVGTFGYNISDSRSRTWATDRSNYISKIRGYDYGLFNETDEFYKKSALPYGGILKKDNINSTSYTVRNALEYRRLLDDMHLIHAFGAVEIKSDRYIGDMVTGYGWNPMFGEIFMPVYTDNFNKDYVQTGKLNPTVTNKLTQVASFIGTFSYAYNNKYVLNGSVRSDGSNKFGSDPKYRWLPTWMISGAWNISDETFMQDISWLDYMRLRASYGLQGNIHDQSSPNLIVQYSSRDPRSGLDYYKIYRLPNPELRWERTSSWNAGVDFMLFGNRLKGGLDVYRKRTKDLIMDKYVPTSNGRAQLFFNAGKMNNRGFEGFLQYTAIENSDWNLRLGVNFGRNVNEVVLANGDAFSNMEQLDKLLSGLLAVEGAPVGAMYSFEFAGLSSENGYPLFYDKDGKKVHMGDPDMMRLVYSGSIFPKLYGGFDIHLAYKRQVYLDMGFTYNFGNVRRLPSIYSNQRAVFDPLQNVSVKHLDRWRRPGDEKNTDIPAFYNDDLARSFLHDPDLCTMKTGSNNYEFPTYFYDLSTVQVAKGDFLKLKSVRVSYALSEKVTKKMNMQGVRFSLSVSNIFTIADKKWEGLDPESAGANIPNLPIYTFGLTLNF